MKQKVNQESRISNQRERLRKKLEQKQQAAMQQKLIQGTNGRYATTNVGYAAANTKY